MPIKKSTLEQKWYYRIARVFVSLLPLATIAYFYLSQKLSPVEFIKNNAVFIGIGIVAYIVIVILSWRLFLYIVFGGLENDMRKTGGAAPAAAQSTAARDNGLGALIFLIIVMILIAVYSSSQSDKKPTNNSAGTTTKQNASPSTNNTNADNKDNNKDNNIDNSSGCVPTGCGSYWRCVGSYYSSGKRMDVDGCYPKGMRPSDIISGWSGTCRQCP